MICRTKTVLSTTCICWEKNVRTQPQNDRCRNSMSLPQEHSEKCRVVKVHRVGKPRKLFGCTCYRGSEGAARAQRQRRQPVEHDQRLLGGQPQQHEQHQQPGQHQQLGLPRLRRQPAPPQRVRRIFSCRSPCSSSGRQAVQAIRGVCQARVMRCARVMLFDKRCKDHHERLGFLVLMSVPEGLGLQLRLQPRQIRLASSEHLRQVCFTGQACKEGTGRHRLMHSYLLAHVRCANTAFRWGMIV